MASKKKNVDGLGIYLFLWVRLIAISVCASWLYLGSIDILADFEFDLVNATEATRTTLQGTILGMVLKYVAGTLFVWRVVKVIVLLGSPLTFGVAMGAGRKNGGVNGRLVTLGHIGDIDGYRSDYKGKLWFGVIARSHPGSDKIVHSRLELLLMALPFRWDIAIYDSRFLFARRTHESRCKTFRLSHDKYNKTNENMPPDRYRERMLDAVKSMGNVLTGNGSKNE